MSKDMFKDMLWDVTWNWDHYIIWTSGPNYNTIKQIPSKDSQGKIIRRGLLQGMDMLFGIKVI